MNLRECWENFKALSIKQTFLNGMMAIIPITITFALIIWILTTIDSIFAYVIIKLFPHWYFEGLGILIGLIVVFIVGVVINAWAVKRFQEMGEEFIQRIPFVKTLYKGVSDLLTFFQGTAKQQQRVVLVTLPIGRVVGFMTRDSFDSLPAAMASKGEVVVYIPLSYQIGGLTLMVPPSAVEYVDMSIEEAMRFVVLAGMAAKTPNTNKH